MPKHLSLALVPFLLSTYVYAQTDQASDNVSTLDPIVVTVAHSDEPNKITLDPKDPVQPIPAADGAGLLKTVPNMSVIRKGGMSSDPLFRGLGGSRLVITSNDGFLFGGCSNRMDPPTSYIFPESYDEVVITKGPQSVTKGAGLVTGSVEFRRDPIYFAQPDINFDASFTAGSFSRYDGYASLTAGMPFGYINFNANRNISHDYEDGEGNSVHSAYQRHNENIALGITPDQDTTIEFNYARSRGWASYADRGMDGAKFDRDAFGVLLEKRNVTSWLSKLTAEYNHSYIDHVMDNYSHRQAPTSTTSSSMSGMNHSGMTDMDGMSGMSGMSGMNSMSSMSSMDMGGMDDMDDMDMGSSSSMSGGMNMPMADNPDRTTDTVRVSGTLEFGDTSTQVGFDWMGDRHRDRSGMGDTAEEAEAAYRNATRTKQQRFTNWGLFAESTWRITENKKLIGGYRHDETRAIYYAGNSNYANAIADNGSARRDFSLNAAFLRYEQRNGNFTYYAGYGFAQRAPDFWERNRTYGWTLKPETNHEIDLGLLYKDSKLKASLTFFASRVNNFILIDDSGKTARNIDAERFGFEGDINYEFIPHWHVGTSMAYTYGKNMSDHSPLAQTPPFEANSYIGYDNGTASVSFLMRNVAHQTRVALGQGNIVGYDTSTSSGFSVFSINGGWKVSKNFKITAGVDNLFNKQYSEFINKSSAAVAGYVDYNGVTIYEPGRQYWVRLQGTF